jgi:hypothetical protein
MRLSPFRSSAPQLALVLAAAAALAACDTRTPTGLQVGNPGGTPAGNGGTGTGTGSDRVRPTVAFETPDSNAVFNLGDSILVRVHARDAGGLQSMQLSGISIRGSAALGTAVVIPRFEAPTVTLRPGLKDTTVSRWLKPRVPVDTTQDSLVVVVVTTDQAGNVDSTRRRVNLVSGPKLVLLTPQPGDSVRPGVALNVQLRVTHGSDIGRVTVRVQGEASWPTPLDVTIDSVYNGGRDVSFQRAVPIPANAPPRGRITITAQAFDVDRTPGSSTPIVVYVQATPAALPRVTQTVPARAEVNDSIVVNAAGDGIRSIGFVVRDSANTIVRRDSVVFRAPFVSPQRAALPLNLPNLTQGQKVTVSSFAWDQNGRAGFSLPANVSTPQGDAARAFSDTTLVVHGRTFALPRAGIAGDIAADASRGNVFVSNTSFNRVEIWQGSRAAFDASGVAVGSEPWGMSMTAGSNDTLLVANSGGTNISRVFVGSSDPRNIVEDVAGRIKTRNTYLYIVNENRDEATQKIRLTVQGPISYSDRPQYVQQSAGGRIFYSTKPTPTAREGTIRWLDPDAKLPVPDPQQVYQYGNFNVGSTASSRQYVIFNVDSVGVSPAPANSAAWDKITFFDHPYGQRSGTLVYTDSVIGATTVAKYDSVGKVIGTEQLAGAIVGLHKQGSGADTSDAFAVLGLDVASLALTDTTFVASSADRKWIGFGEGNRSGAGRVMLVNDPNGPLPGFFSPSVTVRDILDNASEPVFGIALDRTGEMLATHGVQSYFAAIGNPFHLRLQGKFDSFDKGAGIAFHPQADLTNAAFNSGTNLAFVASANGTIEIVDATFFTSRGRLQVKNNLYGPLRASLRFPSDPPDVVLKLFGMTTQGLVVIDLTSRDIQPLR